MRIALGADDEGGLPAAVIAHLREAGHDVELPVPVGAPWPEVGHAVGRVVAAGAADVGIVACWTGTGVSIAANKVPGVRAALCTDVGTAEGARRWNDANVLALSMERTPADVAVVIVDAFLATDPDPSEQPVIDRVEG
jgi:ribose 5-phosphate isomerase B